MEPEESLHSLQLATSSYPEPDQSSPCPHPTTERYTLLIFSHLRLGLPSGVFPSGFSTQTNTIIIIINEQTYIEQSYRWLKSGDIKGETESTIVAAQEKQLVQNILRIKFLRKKLRVNAGYVNKMKKPLTT